MGFTTAYYNSQLNHVNGTSYPAAPGTVYLALFSGMPNAAGSNAVEVTGTRTAVSFGSPATDTGGWQSMSNSGTVTQTIATVCWIVGFGIYTASTNGTLIYFHTLPAPIQIRTASTSLVIPVGAITVYHPDF